MRIGAALLVALSFAAPGCTEFETTLEGIGQSVGSTLDSAFGTTYTQDTVPGRPPEREPAGRTFATNQ
ncbi:MAG: hypothetical protein WD749_12215, partial [Phycisphaerales bacterium]